MAAVNVDSEEHADVIRRRRRTQGRSAARLEKLFLSLA